MFHYAKCGCFTMSFVYCQGSDQENKTIIRVRDGTCRHGFFWMNLGMALHAFPHKNVKFLGRSLINVYLYARYSLIKMYQQMEYSLIKM